MAEPDIIFRWGPIADLGSFSIKPDFLVEGIKSLPTTLTHLQIDDGFHAPTSLGAGD
jgi:hypothetical protein